MHNTATSVDVPAQEQVIDVNPINTSDVQIPPKASRWGKVKSFIYSHEVVLVGVGILLTCLLRQFFVYWSSITTGLEQSLATGLTDFVDKSMYFICWYLTTQAAVTNAMNKSDKPGQTTK